MLPNQQRCAWKTPRPIVPRRTRAAAAPGRSAAAGGPPHLEALGSNASAATRTKESNNDSSAMPTRIMAEDVPLIRKVERFKADLNVNGANARDVILATAAVLCVPTEGQALGSLATACWKLLYGDGDEGASSGAGSSSSGEQPDITKVRVRVRTRAKVRARVRVRAGVRATARARA